MKIFLVIIFVAASVLFAWHQYVIGIFNNNAKNKFFNHKEEKITGIVNGKAASEHKYPFMAFLKDNENDKPFCGASIVDARWILTAAHCVLIRNEMSLDSTTSKIGVGSSFLNNAKLVTFEKVYYHEKFNSSRIQDGYDLALIKLTYPLKLDNKTIQSIGLVPPWKHFLKVNGPIRVAGWGIQQESEDKDLSQPWEQPLILREADQIILDTVECQNLLKDKYQVEPKENQICSIDEIEHGDSCQGDSGGPLFEVAGKGEFFQHGIVSYGIGCGRTSIPGIYTSVGYFYDWIFEHIHS